MGTCCSTENPNQNIKESQKRIQNTDGITQNYYPDKKQIHNEFILISGSVNSKNIAQFYCNLCEYIPFIDKIGICPDCIKMGIFKLYCYNHLESYVESNGVCQQYHEIEKDQITNLNAEFMSRFRKLMIICPNSQQKDQSKQCKKQILYLDALNHLETCQKEKEVNFRGQILKFFQELQKINYLQYGCDEFETYTKEQRIEQIIQQHYGIRKDSAIKIDQILQLESQDKAIQEKQNKNKEFDQKIEEGSSKSSASEIEEYQENLGIENIEENILGHGLKLEQQNDEFYQQIKNQEIDDLDELDKMQKLRQQKKEAFRDEIQLEFDENFEKNKNLQKQEIINFPQSPLKNHSFTTIDEEEEEENDNLEDLDDNLLEQNSQQKMQISQKNSLEKENSTENTVEEYDNGCRYEFSQQEQKYVNVAEKTVILNYTSKKMLYGFEAQDKYREISIGFQDDKIVDEHYYLKGKNSQYPVNYGIVYNWEQMQSIIEYTLTKKLKIEDISNTPVMISDFPGNTQENREFMIQIMFEDLKIPKIYIANTPVLQCVSTGKTSGQTLYCGNSHTYSASVFDGTLLRPSVNISYLSGQQITDQLQRLLYEVTTQLGEQKYNYIVKNIKEQKCFISQNIISEDDDTSVFTLPDGQKINLESQKFKCCEILFNPSLYGYNDQIPIQNIIKNSIQTNDLTFQKELYRNFVVSGGTGLLYGFNNRIQKELSNFTKNDIQITTNVNKMWEGGKILSKMDSFSHNWITKQEYEEEGAWILNKKYQ